MKAIGDLMFGFCFDCWLFAPWPVPYWLINHCHDSDGVTNSVLRRLPSRALKPTYKGFTSVCKFLRMLRHSEG